MHNKVELQLDCFQASWNNTNNQQTESYFTGGKMFIDLKALFAFPVCFIFGVVCLILWRKWKKG